MRSAWCSWRAMASDREAEEVRQTENRSGVCRIRDLLAQAVRCLDNPSEAAAGSVPGRGRGHVLPGSTLSGSTVVQPASNASSLIARSTSSRASSSFGTTSSSSRLISERNCLFNYGQNSRSMRRGSAAGSGGKWKRKRVAMWAHDFTCLNKTDQAKTPTAMERCRLISAGVIK